MPRYSFLLWVFQIYSAPYHGSRAFTPSNRKVACSHLSHGKVRLENIVQPPRTFISAASRYSDGSGDSNDLQQAPDGKSQQSSTTKESFQNLVDQVMKISQPEHVPRLLANNIELIMGLQGEEGSQVISSILEDAKGGGEKDDGGDSYAQTLQTVEMILNFAEVFVREAQEMDESNKKLLGRILKTMVKSENDTSISGGEGRILGGDDESTREEALNRLMKEEKKNFTTGFLRHLQGECDRISSQPEATQESVGLLEILRMIQTRVLEELGQDLGEAALVLGQLMGYEKEEELLGVLEAGLTVRGNEFALEMAGLTEEALDGFSRVPGGADPELIKKVQFIDKRLQEFLNDTNEFQ